MVNHFTNTNSLFHFTVIDCIDHERTVTVLVLATAQIFLGGGKFDKVTIKSSNICLIQCYRHVLLVLFFKYISFKDTKNEEAHGIRLHTHPLV